MTARERACQLFADSVTAMHDQNNNARFVQDVIVEINEQAIQAAVEAERQAILAVAMEVEREAAILMKKSLDTYSLEYHKGRGLGAAVIIKRIRERSTAHIAKRERND